MMDVAADKGTSSSYFFGSDNNGNTDQLLHTGYNNDSSIKFAMYGDDQNITVGTPFLPPIQPHLWTFELPTNLTRAIYLGHTVLGTQNANRLLTGPSFQAGTFNGRVGRANGGNNYLGDFAEVILYNTALSGLDRTNIEDYLNVKWVTGLSNAITSVITVQSTPIVSINFVGTLNNTVEGTPITANSLGQVQVQALNASSGGVPGVTITINIQTGNGAIVNNTAVTDSSGIAHFTNLHIDKIGTKALVATSAGLNSPSSSVLITAAAPAYFAVETAVDGSGVILPTQQVQADVSTTVYAISRDAASNFVANVAATWSLINTTSIVAPGVVAGDLVPSGDTKSAVFTGHYGGTATIQAVGTFTGLSGVQTVIGGAPNEIFITQQPSPTASVGVPFVPQPIVEILDHYSNLVLNSSIVVTSSITGGGSINAGGRNTGGIVAPVTATTANGVATFTGLFATNSGTITLTFVSGSIIPTNSANIVMSSGPVQQLVWITQPGLATNGLAIGQTPVIQTADAAGNLTTNGLPAIKMVQLAIYSGNGVLSGIITTNIGTTGGNGTVALPNLQLSTPGTIQLIASDIGLGYNPTNIAPGATCAMWFDAADLSSMKFGITNNVVRWADKSGQNNFADTNNRGGGVYQAPVSFTNQTLLNQLTGLNGRGRVLRFFQNPRLGFNMMALSNTPLTVIMVELTSGSGGTIYYFGNGGPGGTDQDLHLGYNSNTDYHFGMFGDDLDFNPGSLPGVLPRVETCKLGGGNQTVYFNGVQVGNRANGNFLHNGTIANGTIGAGNGGSPFLGDIEEVVAYSSALSDADRGNVEDYLLTKWKTGLQPGISTPFVVQSLPIGSIAFVSTSINNAASEAPITAASLGEVQVKVLSNSSQPLPGATVTVSISSGTGTISNNVAVTDVSGIAHFPNLNIDLIGTKQIVANSLTNISPVSSSFVITSGAAAALSVESAANGSGSVIPAENVPAGVPQIFYAISRDAVGNYIANVAASWSLFNLNGGVVNGDLVVALDTKSATFTGHILGTAQVQASTTFNGSSGVLNVVGGAPAYFVFTNEPSAATPMVGAPFDTQPVLGVFDQFGNIAFTNTVVTATETSGGNLNATTLPITVHVDATGAATFSGLFVTNTGLVTLTFTSGSVSTNSSPAINVAIGNVARYVWSTEPPSSAKPGQVLSSSPVLMTADAGGHITLNGLPSNRYVQIGLFGYNGGLAGTLTANMGAAGHNGTLTLSDLQILQSGAYQLIALDEGDGTSPTNITDGASCQLWLDASDLNTFSLTGTNVLTWMDKSGTGNNATNGNYGTNGTPPSIAIDSTLSAITAGQGRAVHFDGLTNTLGMSLNSISGSPFTIIATIVPNLKSTSGSSYYIGCGFSIANSSVGNDNNLHVGFQTPTNYRFGQYGDDLDSGNTNFAYPAVYTFTERHDATHLQNLFENSALIGSRTAAGFLRGPNLLNGNIGTGFEPGDNFFGDVAEIMVFNTALTDGERGQLESYLANKWVSGYPGAVSTTINVLPPYSTITTVGVSGSNFNLSATNGTPFGGFHVLSTTNLANPVWLPVYSGTADMNGNINATLPVSSANPDTFYRLVIP